MVYSLHFTEPQSAEPWQYYDYKTFAFVTPEYMKSTNRAFSGNKHICMKFNMLIS